VKETLYDSLPKILGRLVYTYQHRPSGLMKPVGSHGSLSLLFVMKVMVRHFVSNSDEVMTTLIVVFPSKCCCGFSLRSHRYIQIFQSLQVYFSSELKTLRPLIPPYLWKF
jgi:hypothetical protein